MNFKEIDRARKILQLGESATLKEIRDSYRKLSLQTHPDSSRCKDKKNGAEAFKEITAAYDTIMSYCLQYRYSFKKQDVEETADKDIDEEHLKNFYDGWLVDFEKRD